jgi:hypothetical protein
LPVEGSVHDMVPSLSSRNGEVSISVFEEAGLVASPKVPLAIGVTYNGALVPELSIKRGRASESGTT